MVVLHDSQYQLICCFNNGKILWVERSMLVYLSWDHPILEQLAREERF